MSKFLVSRILACWLLSFSLAVAAVMLNVAPVEAQTFRFILRAEPEVIPANGVSTTSILVQVQNADGFNLSNLPVVRFITTRGSIESQARLIGGIARVRLRSTNTPGTAVVTAIIGNAREEVFVEFTDEAGDVARFLEVAAPYVDYGSEGGVISTSGPSILNFGETHIEGDVRMFVDLFSERVWVEGISGSVLIRHGGTGSRALRGDRLYYDLRRRRGVIRRADTTDGPARQEFQGFDFKPLDEPDAGAATPSPFTLSSQSVLPKSAIEQALAERARLQIEYLNAANSQNGAPLQGTSRDNEATNGESLPLALDTPQPESAPEETTSLAEGASQSNPQESTPQDGSQTTAPAVTDGTVPLDITPLDITPPVSPVTEGSPFDVPVLAAPPSVPGAAMTPPSVLGAMPSSSYQPILPDTPVELRAVRLNDPPLPEVERARGYWITARRIRVFPHDKIQFERATVFFNGIKLFGMPLYVQSLTGSTNPVEGLVGFNSSGGLRLNLPFYYMASPGGTGAVYLQHAPTNGFAAEKPGFALAVEQQYWLSNRSFGKLYVDQLGRGDWNLDWQHKLQLTPSTTSSFYVNMPRHKDLYAYSTVVKDLSKVQLGFEGSYSRPEEGSGSAQGQVFAQLRPRMLGSSGWVYNVSANLLTRRFSDVTETSTGGGNTGGVGTGGVGGGIGLPGQTRAGGVGIPGQPGSGDGGDPATPAASSSTLFGQTANISLQSPAYQPWKGADIQATVLGTAFNYSTGRRGIAPGLMLAWRQNVGRVASLQLDYNYDKGNSRLYGTDFTHYLSGTLGLNLGRKIYANGYFSRSFTDGSMYGTIGLDYYFRPKWRLGLFTDYSKFNDFDPFINYGATLGRTIGQREVSINWDKDRGRVYLELGGFRL